VSSWFKRPPRVLEYAVGYVWQLTTISVSLSYKQSEATRIRLQQQLLHHQNQDREPEWSLQERANLVHKTLIPSVTEAIAGGRYFAVGVSATHNVSNRTSQYYPLRDGWSRGYVCLHTSTNPINILNLEDDLIQRFKDYEFLTNKNGGGGGLINAEHPSWTLYLKLADKKPNEHWYAKNFKIKK
jgi:hypothetical protein